MSLAKWIGFGSAQSSSNGHAPPPTTAPDSVKIGTISKAEYKQFGLENFGNTCYANSVLQALYFCHPFRELVLQVEDKSNPLVPGSYSTAPPPTLSPNLRAKNARKPSSSEVRTVADGSTAASTSAIPSGPPIPASPPTLFSALRALFQHISNNSLDKGVISPKSFIEKLKKENELFRSSMHQDAHEFLIYLLNKIAEELEEETRNRRSRASSGEDLSNSMTSSGPSTLGTALSCSPGQTLVQAMFEGILTSETRCLTCETVSSRDEAFLDLSIDIEQNSSVTACLRQFSASEMLCQKNKFFCDSCCGLQEAEKRMKIKKLPNVLALHLKRFKYQEDAQKYVKLTYRIAFPLELRLFNTADDAVDPDRLYELFAIVVHIGNGPHHGHYVAIVKSRGSWVIFDDDAVEPVKESDIPKYFGDSNSGSAYVLFYQAVDIGPTALGLKQTEQTTQEPAPNSSPVVTPAFPPGLTHEGDSDTSELAPGTPASPSCAPSPTILSTPPVSIIPPPEPSAPIPVPNITPTPNSPQVKQGFFSLRHSPSKPSVGSSIRTSLYDSTSAPPVPPMPPLAASPKVTNEFSEASTSTNSTLPVAPTINGQLKSPKEKPSGWFKRRSLRRADDKAAKRHERPATSYETRDRHDGSSLTSSSTSSRLPLVSDNVASGQPVTTLTESYTVHSDSSFSPDQPIPVNTAMSRSPVLTSTPPSSTASHSHLISDHLHIPSHKKSQPALSPAPLAKPLSASRPSRRPSTAGAATSSPTSRTFSTDTLAPLPPLPRDFQSPRIRKDSLPALPPTGNDPVRQRNSIIASSSPPPVSPPVAINNKRASRKLSFTGGMLSFTRRDKDKDKHKDKETDTQGAMSSSSPNTLSPVPPASFSMFGRL